MQLQAIQLLFDLLNLDDASTINLICKVYFNIFGLQTRI